MYMLVHVDLRNHLGDSMIWSCATCISLVCPALLESYDRFPSSKRKYHSWRFLTLRHHKATKIDVFFACSALNWTDWMIRKCSWVQCHDSLESLTIKMEKAKGLRFYTAYHILVWLQSKLPALGTATHPCRRVLRGSAATCSGPQGAE